MKILFRYIYCDIYHRIQNPQVSDEFIEAIVSSFGGYLGNGLAVTNLFTQLLGIKKGHPLNSCTPEDSVKLSEIVAEAPLNLLIVNSEPVQKSIQIDGDCVVLGMCCIILAILEVTVQGL